MMVEVQVTPAFPVSFGHVSEDWVEGATQITIRMAKSFDLTDEFAAVAHEVGWPGTGSVDLINLRARRNTFGPWSWEPECDGLHNGPLKHSGFRTYLLLTKGGEQGIRTMAEHLMRIHLSPPCGGFGRERLQTFYDGDARVRISQRLHWYHHHYANA